MTRTDDQRGRGSCVLFCPRFAPLQLRFARLLRLEGAGLYVTIGLIGCEDHASVRHEMVDQLHSARGDRSVEDRLSMTEHDRVGDQYEPVDEPCRKQRWVE